MTDQMDESDLIARIRELSPDRRAEVRDFVDFLRLRQQQKVGAKELSLASERAFAGVWDNPDDAEYDKL